eukprot:gene4849-8434_t
MQFPTKLFVKKVKTDEIVIKNGFRFIKPYTHTFKMYVKQRWIGKTLQQVYEDEFSMPNQIAEKLIFDGKILINDEKTSNDKILKNNELISLEDNDRIEFPIINFDYVEVLYENDDIFVINKPPSMPIHPSGSYYKNALIKILRDEFDLPFLKLIHRLDKVTTGVLIFAKNPSRAFEIQTLFKEHKVTKMYLAKVHGKFSEEKEVKVDVPLQRLNIRKGIWRIASPNILLNDGSKLNNENLIVKSANTVFKFVSYDNINDTSIVLCLPKTGRTHQLREHLRYLNHSIVHDEEIQKLKEYKPRHWGEERNFLNEKYTDITKMFIYLHAIQYEFENFKFKCYPNWISNKDEMEIIERLINEEK